MILHLKWSLSRCVRSWWVGRTSIFWRVWSYPFKELWMVQFDICSILNLLEGTDGQFDWWQHVLDSHRWVPLPPVGLGRGSSGLDNTSEDVAPPYSLMENPPLAAFVNGRLWLVFFTNKWSTSGSLIFEFAVFLMLVQKLIGWNRFSVLWVGLKQSLIITWASSGYQHMEYFWWSLCLWFVASQYALAKISNMCLTFSVYRCLGCTEWVETLCSYQPERSTSIGASMCIAECGWFSSPIQHNSHSSWQWKEPLLGHVPGIYWGIFWTLVWVRSYMQFDSGHLWVSGFPY